MRKLLFLLIIPIFLFPSASYAAGTCGSADDGVGSTHSTGTNPWTADSASYADVNYCVNTSAAEGDTVNVPAGSETWNSRLHITKGINLIGAGAANTIITNNYTSVGGTENPTYYLITYVPDTPANNTPFRISGFNFNLAGNKASWLYVVNADTRNNIPQTNIRIDNNVLDNGGKMKFTGSTWGVIDSNTWNDPGSGNVIVLFAYGGNFGSENAWNNTACVPGSINNLYFEDNTLNSLEFYPLSSGYGGRYVIRYNTFTLSTQLWPLIDAHGNQGDNYTSMGADVYGNLINSNYNFDLLDHRGGKGLVFYNKVSGTGRMEYHVREENADSGLSPANNPIDGTPQHVNNAYNWNNRNQNGTLIHAYEMGDISPPAITINVEYFSHDYPSSFDGTAGMGCGTLGSRPATCTTGVGYWATDQTCSSVSDDHVGVSPTTPISGTLYKCTSADTWAEHYTPYIYPHPLRRISLKPPPPTGLRIIQIER